MSKKYRGKYPKKQRNGRIAGTTLILGKNFVRASNCYRPQGDFAVIERVVDGDILEGEWLCATDNSRA